MSEQQWGQQQPPKKKRHWIRNTVFGFAAFIVVMTIFGALGSSSTGTTAAKDDAPAREDQPAKQKSKPKTAGIGDQVRDGKFAFTVTDVTAGKHHVGDKDFGSDAQGEFVIVSVTVENIGDEAQTLDSSSQTAYDAGGRKFDADTEAGISLDSKTFLEAINPGNSVEGKLVFDVPRGTDLVSLELHDSMFSGGVEVDLR